MKLLVLCPRFPYPLEKGDKLRIYHQLKLLQESFELCLVTLCDDDIDSRYTSQIEEITHRCHVLKLTKRIRKKNALLGMLNSRPIQVSYYYSKKTQRELDKIVEDFKPDHIYCQLVRMAPYVLQYSIPKTLDYMDAFGVGMERRAAVVTGIQKLFYKLESGRVKKYESKIYSEFSQHTIISEQDRKCIGSGDYDITINPNGIDTLYFSPMDKKKEYDIGFVGNMGYLPNVEAAEYLVNELQLGSETKILIAGARPDKRVKLLSKYNVTVTGWVDDVRNEYARCNIFVAPLWSGTGQQNKILEAMAMGIPCITTPAVNNALHGEDGKDLLLADTKQEFIKAIDRLQRDKELYHTIRENGLKLVKDNFSWHHNVDILKSLILKS